MAHRLFHSRKLSQPTIGQGFTLVEMLVVVSIISVLAITGTVVYSNVSRDSRDARRLRDMDALKQSLELYFHDNNKYPDSGDPDNESIHSWQCGTVFGVELTCWNSILTSYLNPMPQDPYNNYSSDFFYMYKTENFTGCPAKGSWYIIGAATLEDSNNPNTVGNKDVKWCNGTTSLQAEYASHPSAYFYVQI